MPKLKCPSESELNDSVASLWRNVESEYIQVHRESSRLSQLSIEATEKYKYDCRKRAKPVLNWVKYQCQQHGFTFDFKSVHLIDHSQNPWVARPWFTFVLSVKDKLWLKLEVTVYEPKSFDEVREKVNVAFAALAAIS